jgi:uncharacterized protein involved in copper resistance
MKKLVLALLASAVGTIALANPVATSTAPAATQEAPVAASQPVAMKKAPEHKKPTHPAFNHRDIVCGDKILGQTENADSLAGSCKNYKFKDHVATFTDGHSGEHVACKINEAGLLETNTCHPTKHKK